MIAIVIVMVMMMPENNEDDCQNDENNLEDWRTSNVRWPSFSCSTQWWKLLDLREKFTKKNTLFIWILPKLPPSLGNVVSVSPWHGGKDLSRDGSLEAVDDPSHMITGRLPRRTMSAHNLLHWHKLSVKFSGLSSATWDYQDHHLLLRTTQPLPQRQSLNWSPKPCNREWKEAGHELRIPAVGILMSSDRPVVGDI